MKKSRHFILQWVFLIAFASQAQSPNSLITLQRLTSTPPDSIKVYFNKADWYYIAWTKAIDRTGIIYINGEPVYTGTFQDVLYNHTQVHIAARFFTEFHAFFSGQIDELRISNKARTASEIKNYYLTNQPFSTDANTVALWHFDEGSGNTFGNVQGGAGQLIGGPTWIPGKFGTAVQYDGIDDRGQTNFDPPENNTTYEFWVRLPFDLTEAKTLIQAYSFNNYDMMVHPYVEPNSAPTNIFVSSSSVLENLPIGSTVSTLTAADAEGGLISYSLVSGTGDTDNSSFSINGDQLKTTAVLDYETKASYSIRIRATDSGGLFFEKQFTISVSPAPNTLLYLQRLTTLPPDSIKVNFNKTDWYYLAWTKATDRTGIIYLNGEPIFNGTFQDDQYNHNQIHIAARFFTEFGAFFNGQIDEVRVSNTARNATEIKNYYLANQPFTTDENTVALWHFDEGTGSTFGNTKGGSGQLIGGPTWIQGKFGTAVQYDGIDDRGQTNFDPPENNTTYEFWVRFPFDITEAKTLIQAYAINNYDMQILPLPVKQAQHITFNSLNPKIYGDAPFALTAFSNSALPITYSSSDPNVATISGNTVTIKTAGTTIITATQAGNNLYGPAQPVQQTLTINKASLTVTANNKSRTYGDANPAFTLTYTGFKNNETISVIDTLPTASSSATETSNAGNYNIVPVGGMDNNYSFIYSNGTLTVTKSILIASADNKSRIYGNSNPLFTITYSGFKNNETATVIDTAPTATTTATQTSILGVYDIIVSGGTDNNYNFTYINGVLTIVGQEQTITFLTPNDVLETIGTFTLNATSSSGLPVTFSTTSLGNISITGNIVTVSSPGMVTIIANQEGNNQYQAAVPVSKTICILPKKPSITATGLDSENVILTSSSNNNNVWYRNNMALPGGTNTSYTVDGKGIYTVKVIVDGCSSEFSDPYAIIITQVNDSEHSINLSLNPNPASHELKITLSGAIESETSDMIVYDLLGRVISKEIMNGNEHLLLLDKYPPGNYLIRITNNSLLINKRFVKQ